MLQLTLPAFWSFPSCTDQDLTIGKLEKARRYGEIEREGGKRMKRSRWRQKKINKLLFWE